MPEKPSPSTYSSQTDSIETPETWAGNAETLVRNTAAKFSIQEKNLTAGDRISEKNWRGQNISRQSESIAYDGTGDYP